MNTDGGGGPAAQDLQFDKAEFAGAPTARICQRCQRSITDEYFDAGGQAICAACSEELTGARGGRTAFLRALALGAGAALAGTLVWFAIIKLSNSEWGLVGILVGLAVGYAVRKGSRGRGGWKFQALAMALTYVSITASYVPLVIKEFVNAAEKKEQEQGVAGQKPGQPAAPDKPEAAADRTEVKPDGSGGATILGVVLFLGLAFALALASPFLAGMENIMGLLIIAIALYEAWKLNRRVVVTGPFRLAPSEPAAQAAASG